MLENYCKSWYEREEFVPVLKNEALSSACSDENSQKASNSSRELNLRPRKLKQALQTALSC
jgi:hypothetical protein